MHDGQTDHPFLTTARALGACTREFARLSDGIAERAAGSFSDAVALEIRRSPERCILQIGPSALTVAWIRAKRDSAEGELLAIHWHGTVAPVVRQKPEHLGQPTLTARALNESVFIAEATSESDWTWRSRDEPTRCYSSPTLAALLVDHLRIVHDAAEGRVSA